MLEHETVQKIVSNFLRGKKTITDEEIGVFLASYEHNMSVIKIVLEKRLYSPLYIRERGCYVRITRKSQKRFY